MSSVHSFCKPTPFLRQCVVRWMEGDSCPDKTTEEQCQILGIQNYVNSTLCLVQNIFSPLVKVYESIVGANNTTWAECSASIPCFSLSLCNGAHGLTGDWFLWAQHLYFLHLAVFSHSSCSLTTAPSCFLFLWGLTGQRASVPLEEKKKRAAKRMSQRFTAASICHPEDEVYEVYDFVLFIGYNVKCREPCLLICQKHGSYSLPRGGGDWRETEWSARLDYCPGAMVTGTNRYCISLIWIRVGGCLSPHSHTHKHTWTFNDSYLIGKGASRRGQTPPGWCVDVQGVSKCSWMALMRVANGDIKREWVHFSL